jgi:hypothetical protein
MTAKHFDQVLITLADRKPFRPFIVEISGGQWFEVDHPRAMVNRQDVAVFLAPDSAPISFDHESLLLIIADIANAGA